MTTGHASLAEFFAALGDCRDKNPLTHGLHPYPAKYIPHIPRALLREFARPGSVVLDPMCGSGTSLVEASTMGMPAIGVDLNPIAVLISKAKTTPLPAQQNMALLDLAAHFHGIARSGHATRIRLERSLGTDDVPRFLNRDKWFRPQVILELAYARKLICDLPARARTLAMCAFSSQIVRVSNQESETRWCAKDNVLPIGAALGAIAGRMVKSAAAVQEYAQLEPACVHVHEANAASLPLESGQADVAVFSPPYANSHDYYLYNKLRIFWLGKDVKRVQEQEIGSRNRHSDLKEGVERYLKEMGSVLAETRRVVRQGGHIAIVVADAVIRGTLHRMDTLFDDVASGVGLSKTSGFRFSHKRFNAAFHRRFGTTKNKDTHVLVYRV